MLIRFTSKSCGICERFSKDWKEVVKSSDKKYVMSVDCDKDLKFCLERNILSFPSFYLYNRWEGFYKYHGSQHKNALISLIKTLEEKDCYLENACSEKFNTWLKSSPNMSLKDAKRNLTDINVRFADLLNNVTKEIAFKKRFALERVNYINKHYNEL